MRQMATPRMYFEPRPDWPMAGDSSPLDPAQLLLLGIERALAPPIVHLRTTFQPVRVVIVGPDLMPPDEAPGFNLPRALPQAAMMSAHARSQFHQRAIQGEVLVDDDGRVYEKCGRRIRPVTQLASGVNGELIELVPIINPKLRLIEPPAVPKAVDNDDERAAMSAVQSSKRIVPDKFVPISESENKRDFGYRKLFADPGQWRVVWWADFKEVLAKQLAHPDRLKDTYRLPCYVQVIEVERSMTTEELATSFASENPANKSLFFLTNEIAEKLELAALLPPVPVPNAQRAPNSLLRHDRLFRVLIANDPTVDVAGNATASNATQNLKKEIPTCFTAGRDFAITREEARYDANAARTFSAKVRRFVRQLSVFKRRESLRKWRAMTAGKSPDDQLWTIRPPDNGLTDDNIRAWARQTLASAGYDAESMLTEWEIFWRRRGVA